MIESEYIKAYFTIFERALQAFRVNHWSVILAPQLTGKVMQAYAAMSNVDSQDYWKVKEVIFQSYNIYEETYR